MGDNRWSLASTEGEITHQLVGTQSSLPGIISPFQLPDVHPQSYSFADGQFHCRCIREQERGDQIPGAISSSTGCLGISPGERLLDYGTTHSRVVERGGGCSIKMLQQQLGMDVTLRYLQASDQTVLSTISGPICLTNQPSSATICLSPSSPEAIATDAFLSDWSKWRSWIYPPVILLPRILNKINADRATALILAPHWSGQPWFPQLLEMLVDYPRLLPQRPHLISLPFEPEKAHPLQHKLHLTVWPVSASAIAQRDFQQRLQEFSCPCGVRLPRNDILDRGTLGQAGVVNGRCVPLLPL